MTLRNELQSSTDLVQRIYDTIGKECKKDALIYRSMAIRVLGLLANDYSFEIYDLFWTWFEKAFKLPVSTGIHRLMKFISLHIEGTSGR